MQQKSATAEAVGNGEGRSFAAHALRYEDSRHEDSARTFLAVLALVAAARFAALALNGTDLYMDEAQYWAWSRELAPGYFSKPPLVAWIIRGATALCGDGEACVRLPATLIHLLTACLVYLLAHRLYSARVAFWSGLAYALLPAVSLSSGIISTDVPLLAAWALALFAFAGLIERPNVRDTLLLAVALGIGLNAKYAMAYFIPCAAVFFAVTPAARARLASPHLWIALAGGLFLIAPNLLWNQANNFATFAHTAENANWRGIPFHPDKAAEFLLAQFGVFGPILFGGLLVIVWRSLRGVSDVPQTDRLLLAFSAPVLAAVTIQALLSRAHANWAAPAYIAAVVLVTAVMIRDRDWRWMRASFAIHALVAILIAGATWQAGRFVLPVVGDPFARTLGNREMAAAVRDELADAERRGAPIRAILTDDREIAAALAYYGQNLPVPQLAWRKGATPRSHFEMTHPLTAASPTPLLLVTPRAPSDLTADFGSATGPRIREIRAGMATRTLAFVTLSGFKEK